MLQSHSTDCMGAQQLDKAREKRALLIRLSCVRKHAVTESRLRAYKRRLVDLPEGRSMYGTFYEAKSLIISSLAVGAPGPACQKPSEYCYSCSLSTKVASTTSLQS